MILVGIVVSDPGVRDGTDRPASGSVVIENSFKCWNASVVHVRRRHRDVSERRRFELADIRRSLREFEDPNVRRRVREGAADVIQARVVKFDRTAWYSFGRGSVAEIESAMTSKTRKLLSKE